MQNTQLDRYGIEYRSLDGVQQKAIFRRDLLRNGSRLHVVRGYSRTHEQLSLPDQSHNHVYLDGAAQGPFYDKKRGVYSLDHHELCVRQITDATCIQAINLARTRVIGAVGNTIVGNDPDLDTVFAGWSLLNADVLAHDDRIFRRMHPLMIVEGNIDAHGIGFEELTGLPNEAIADCRQRIVWLMREERELKARGRWGTVDFVDFTAESLDQLDQYAFYRDNMDVPVLMDAQEKISLTNGQELYYVRAPHSGIYEVENTILSHQGNRDCACVVFHDGKAKWTVKLSGFVNVMSLVPVTDALNAAESNAKIAAGVTDEALLRAGWGGGGTIIGAPRYHNGAGPFLSKDRILNIVSSGLNNQVTD